MSKGTIARYEYSFNIISLSKLLSRLVRQRTGLIQTTRRTGRSE